MAARLVLSSAICGAVLGAQSPVGVFTTHGDVGRANGSASYDPKQQTYLVAGSGQNMWGTRDDFHFVWKRISGNFLLSTRARFIGAGVEEHRKIGWTIRPSLNPASAHVTAALHGNGLMSLQLRRQTGGITEEARSSDSLPDADAVIQLERRDGDYLMSVAQFGDTLVTQRLSNISLPDTVYVGLFVCSHNAAVTERATFRDVRITTPASRQAPSHGRPTVFKRGEGEERWMRGTRPLFIVADPVSVGSQTLMAGYEEVPPGDSGRTHKHLMDDEILFVHRGLVDVLLGDSTHRVGSGATIFIPRGTWVSFRAVGADTAGFFFVFNAPGMEKCLRMLSARRGHTFVPPAPAVLQRVNRECHWVLKSQQ